MPPLRFAPIAAALALFATPAGAVTYTFDITGTLLSQIASGTDANISVGDTVHVHAVADEARVVAYGDTGYSVAFLYDRNDLDSFKITVNDLEWFSYYEQFDGLAVYTREFFHDHLEEFGAPAIIFKDGQVVGLTGLLYSVGSDSKVPMIRMGSSVGPIQVRYEQLTPGGPWVPTQTRTSGGISLSETFTIEPPDGRSSNTYPTPGFNGVWNFATSSVTTDGAGPGAPVPEPATWALLIGGFGAAGAMLRRRRLAAGAQANAGV